MITGLSSEEEGSGSRDAKLLSLKRNGPGARHTRKATLEAGRGNKSPRARRFGGVAHQHWLLPKETISEIENAFFSSPQVCGHLL